MKNLFITTFIILFLTSACSNKQPEVVIETSQSKLKSKSLYQSSKPQSLVVQYLLIITSDTSGICKTAA